MVTNKYRIRMFRFFIYIYFYIQGCNCQTELKGIKEESWMYISHKKKPSRMFFGVRQDRIRGPNLWISPLASIIFKISSCGGYLFYLSGIRSNISCGTMRRWCYHTKISLPFKDIHLFVI